MTLEPLREAGPLVAAHAAMAIAAMLAGGAQFALPKGTGAHRAIGYGFAGLMAAVAISSFGIFGFRVIGPFSPIHLLSAFTLYTLWHAVRDARRGDIAGHRRAITLLYVFAIGVTGLFTLWPGRVMHAVLFDG